MKKLNVLITGDEIAEKIKVMLDSHDFNCIEISNCIGFSQKFNLWEYIGATEVRKKILLFNTTEIETKAVIKFVHKYYNERNNGIMFSIEGEKSMTDENILYVAIVNNGKGEKVAHCIRKKALVGATMIEGRGNGGNPEELFGVQIDSAKEIVLSVMPQKKLSVVEHEVKKSFSDDNTDVVSFVLPVSNFNKLHHD